MGFLPDDVVREASAANNADLLLTSGSEAAVVEVKLGHLMSNSQQEKYEALGEGTELYLAALEADEARIGLDSERWAFLRLGDLFAAWTSSEDALARSLASDAARCCRTGTQSFPEHCPPARARPAPPLRWSTRSSWPACSPGGSQPTCASEDAWRTPASPAAVGFRWSRPGFIRGESDDRCFIAEIRWREMPGGELRFGVDFDPRPGQTEDEEVRRAAYELSYSMDESIHHSAVHAALVETRPDLAGALRREKASRPVARGDWEQVILHGLKGAPLESGARNNRRRTTPAFYGDGALRFQAISDIDFSAASAVDLVDLIDLTLEHLADNEPE